MTKEKTNILQKAFNTTAIESTSRIVEPILIFICAKIYFGGEWGEFKIYESFAYIIYRICALGFNQGLLWYKPKVNEPRFLTNVLQTCLFSLTICLSLLLLLFFIQIKYPNFFNFFNIETDNLNTKLWYFLLAAPCMVITEILLYTIIAYKKFLAYNFVFILIRPLFIFGLPILFFVFNIQNSNLSLSFFLGNLIALILSIILFFKHAPLTKECFSWNIFPSKALVFYSFPLALSQWIGVFTVRMDILMLASITSLKYVEIYSIAALIGKSIQSISESLNKFLQYLFSSYNTKKITDTIKKQYNYATWVLISIQSVAMLILICFTQDLLGLINQEYIYGYSVVLISTFFIFVNAHFAFTPTVLASFGITSVFPFFLVITCTCNFLLNYFLIPIYDINGAGIALGLSNLVGYCLLFIVLTIYAKRNLFSKKFVIASLECYLFIASIYLLFTSTISHKFAIIVVLTLTHLLLQYYFYRKIRTV